MKAKKRKGRKPSAFEMKQLLLLNALVEVVQSGQDLRGLYGQLNQEWTATAATAETRSQEPLKRAA